MAAFKYILLVAALLGAASASRLELNGFSEVSVGVLQLSSLSQTYFSGRWMPSLQGVGSLETLRFWTMSRMP